MIGLSSTVVILVLLAACASAGGDGSPPGREVVLAPEAVLPGMVRTAPPVVQEAYRFAVANADVLQYVPCYCGCGGMGHTSNRSCFVKEDRSDGSVTFDDHALGCSICVDIAHDTMRMMRQGKDLRSIQAAIQREYGRYGPPTTLLGG